MAGRQLSNLEIEDLISFHINTQHMLMTARLTPAFDKSETIQILNALTERHTTTADERFTIKYRGEGFLVKPVEGFVPCGNFKSVDEVIERLAL